MTFMTNLSLNHDKKFLPAMYIFVGILPSLSISLLSGFLRSLRLVWLALCKFLRIYLAGFN